MKRLLLPLLAALALPTAVNAKVVNLKCTALGRQHTDYKKYTEKEQFTHYLDIDLDKQTTSVDNGRNITKFNTFITRDAFVLTFINTSFKQKNTYEINRLDGSFSLTNQMLEFVPSSSFYDSQKAAIANKSPDEFDSLLVPIVYGGSCTKAEKIKTMF